MDAIEHGTYAGYQKCRRTPEGTCDACHEAQRLYIQEYRLTHPGYVEKNRKQVSVSRKAMRILKERHLAEYYAIVKDLNSEEKQ